MSETCPKCGAEMTTFKDFGPTKVLTPHIVNGLDCAHRQRAAMTAERDDLAKPKTCPACGGRGVK